MTHLCTDACKDACKDACGSDLPLVIIVGLLILHGYMQFSRLQDTIRELNDLKNKYANENVAKPEGAAEDVAKQD